MGLGLFSLASYIRFWRRLDDARRWPLHQRLLPSLMVSLGLSGLGIGLGLLGILPVFLQDFWFSLLVAASFLVPSGYLLYLAFRRGIDQVPFPQRA
jgi:hypothetical protein